MPSQKQSFSKSRLFCDRSTDDVGLIANPASKKVIDSGSGICWVHTAHRVLRASRNIWHFRLLKRNIVTRHGHRIETFQMCSEKSSFELSENMLLILDRLASMIISPPPQDFLALSKISLPITERT